MAWKLDIRKAHSSFQRQVLAHPGETVREALLRHGVSPYRGKWRWVNCGGLGICGSCRLWLREGDQKWPRRSCQIRCFQDLEIEIE